MVFLSMLPGQQAGLLQTMAHRIPPIQDLDRAALQLSQPVDLIHGFNISWEYPLVVGRQLAQAWQCPLVVTPFLHLGTAGHKRVALNNTMDHQTRLLSEADSVLTLTDTALTGLAEWHIPLRQGAVIGGGVEPAPDIGNAADLIAQFELPAHFLLFIGRANYDKGVVHTLQAVAALQDAGQPLTLAVVGQTTPDFEQASRRFAHRRSGFDTAVGPRQRS